MKLVSELQAPLQIHARASSELWTLAELNNNNYYYYYYLL